MPSLPSNTTRAIVLVLDSVGIGELPDAPAYGDSGSNTLGNLSVRVPLYVPTLRRLGLCQLVSLHGLSPVDHPAAAFGKMAEASPGKDSVTGHWEIAGVVLDRAFPVYPDGFSPDVIAEFERRIGRRTLGNRAASGTRIIEELGAEHMRTGRPIVYTSADSVFQIAAHEDVIPVDELYRFCETAFELVVEGLGMGRVIARPFVGKPGCFSRTANRRDFALAPIGETLLDVLSRVGFPVIAIGKINDLFAGRGIAEAIHTVNDAEVISAVEDAIGRTRQGLIFANLVDFDTLYGHRNDPEGYAANLERFDLSLSTLLPKLRDDDLLVITADHGNDPTTSSTDHSREYVPLLVTGARVVAGVDLGMRESFSDVGQTLADWFDVGRLRHGRSFLAEIIGRAAVDR